MKALLLGAAAALAFSTPALADTLVDNVDGVTIDATGGIDRFTGLLIADDGRIKQVLHRGDKRPERPTYKVDGKGRFIIPGLIDSHGHVMGLGFSALTLDLTEAKSLPDALARIADYAKAHPDRPWIIGRGWNHELWPEKRFPTAAELDAVVPDRPVWLARVDGHAGWANSKALAAAGVVATTKDPAGGKIERIMPGGKPAGVLIDNAMELVETKIPPPRPEDRDLALAKAQDILLSRGVTAIADMGTSIDDWQAFRRAGDYGTLRIRIMAYASGTEQMALIGGPGPSPWLYDDRLRLNGVKLYVDGALGSRGASLKAPYADAPGSKGLRITGDTPLKNLMSRAALDKFQVAVHAIGDEGNAAVLSAIEDLSATYGGDRRWRIEHAQVVDLADIVRFGKHGIIASMQPVHQTSDREMAEKRLGPARLGGAYAWKSIQASGARIVFGSDVPVEAADPFAGWAAAISRTGPDGQPLGGWQVQERVTREEAFAAYTASGAYAGFAEGRFGRLVAGERADFLFIDRDPFLASPAELRATKVIEVWVGGRKVWDSVAVRAVP
ncbi:MULTISPECIES: amidohydrolase [unclassified Novosphingobium]|uniref:amidohydrolase n=1 Tax=unclassified Novosphingobium TaxID=2644732 RepID=UPI0025D5CD66|nr:MULTISPECIES: amidohydrolase [unclassified Novosphingobium]HQV03398.1 amidohydrolase [Novosphingobium sp.]